VFVLNGRPLQLDVPFETGNTLYPANWLRLASPEQREAIGITEVPDIINPYYDQRFYWGYTASGTLIPKDHGVLISDWVSTTKVTANTLLSPSDWSVVRMVDNGTPIPSGVRTWRQDIRNACNEKILNINTTTSTDELASYITSPSYPVWPPQEQPVVAGEGNVGITSDSIFNQGSRDSVFNGVTSSATIYSEGLFGGNGEDTIIL
jgi:hypothetical protein